MASSLHLSGLGYGGVVNASVGSSTITRQTLGTFIMLRTHLCCVLSVVVLLGVLAPEVVGQQAVTEPSTLEKIKIDVNRLGTGDKARAKITLRNGTKLKGYIARQDEDSFVLRNRKTDAPTTVLYADVVKVERNKGHSTARNIAIGVGIGVGALLAIIAIALAHLD